MSEAVIEWQETVLKNFIKKNGEDSISKDQIDHILDWIKSTEAEKYHSRITRISVKQAIEHAERWIKSLNKKANLIEKEDGTEVVHTFPDGYKFVKILTAEAYSREGAIMGHCVASYYGKNNVDIFSLRDTNNDPHCTIELCRTVNNRINQIKGKQNKEVVKKYHKYVLDFLKNSNIPIDEIDSYDIKKVGAHVAGRNIFNFNKQTDLTLVLKGNVNWNKQLDRDEIRPHILKIEGDFSFSNCHTKSSYALFDEIHIGGDLNIDNINGLQRLANRVYIDGNVEISNCLSFLKLGDEVYIGGHANASDCKELKCFGNSGIIQKDIVVIDCKNFQKKITQQVFGQITIE